MQNYSAKKQGDNTPNKHASGKFVASLFFSSVTLLAVIIVQCMFRRSESRGILRAIPLVLNATDVTLWSSPTDYLFSVPCLSHSSPARSFPIIRPDGSGGQQQFPRKRRGGSRPAARGVVPSRAERQLGRE